MFKLLRGAQANLTHPLMPNRGCWPFPEGTGNKVFDYSLRKNPGTIYGGTWVPGKDGWALDLNGSSDYIIAGNTKTFKFLHGGEDVSNFRFTVIAWIELDNPNSSTIQTIISTLYQSGSAFVGMEFIMNDDAYNRALQIVIGRGQAGNYLANIHVDYTYPNNTYKHCVGLSYDNSLSTDNNIFYMDGIAVGGGTNNGGNGSAGDSSIPLNMGRIDGYSLSYLNGRFYDCYISDRVLSPAEHLAFYLNPYVIFEQRKNHNKKEKSWR